MKKHAAKILGCLIAVWWLAGCRPDAGLEPPRPVVVVGIDGATWDVIDPMIAGGELPSFRKLVDRGARADLITLPPLVSPAVWTTYATGTFSRHHNILDFTYPYVAGKKHPVESTHRREPALWNVASDHGRTVGLVGYYVTHPAEKVDGFVVSDRALRGRDGTTYPEELSAELDVIDSAEERRQAFRRFLPWEYRPKDAANPDSPNHAASRIIRGRVDGAIVASENVRRNALKLLPRGVDLFMTYVQIVDHASHSTWQFFDDSDFEQKPDPRARELLGGLIPEAYRYVDDFLGELMRQVGEKANIVLVSDHGSGSATGPYAIRDEQLAGILSGNHRHDGILLAAGPDVRPGVYEGVTMMEVTPLILALLHLPISDELPGRVPEEMLAEPFLDRHPPVHVAAYRKQWQAVDAGAPDARADAEALEQLKALGYLGSSTQAGRGESEQDVDFWSVEPRLRMNALQGELLYHLMREDTETVGRLMKLLRERDPDLASKMPRRIRSGARLLQEDFDFPVLDPSVIERFLEAFDGREPR